MSKIKDRMLNYLQSNNITKQKFCEMTGISYGNITGKSTKSEFGGEQIAQILMKFPQLNPDWLLLGKGEILRTEGISVETTDYILVPVINLDARGGFGPNDVTDTPQATLRYIPFEKNVARQGDIVLPVFGDSMSPQYPAGTLILIRAYEFWREYIDYGNAFVVELEDDSRFIKIVNKASTEGRVLLHSVNPAYEDSEVPISIIRRMYRVVLSMRQETM